MRFLMVAMIVATAISSIGCMSKIAVRDAKVYKAELDFIDAASQEVEERSQELIDLKCECEEVAGEKGFAAKECQKLAETVLVLRVRMKYHTDMMRHLGGLTEKRPPKEPPDVPEPNTLCKE